MNANLKTTSPSPVQHGKHRLLWIIATVGVVLGLSGGVAFAEYCWQYVDNFFAINPQTWECSYSPPSGAAAATPSTQMIVDEHANWHCINGWLGTAGGVGSGPGVGDAGYGLAFLGMHKQMINDFDLFRDSTASLNRIETWDANDFPVGPNYNPMPWGIPGNPQPGFPGAGVSNATAGAIAGGVCLVGTGRSGDGVDPATYTPCPGCTVLQDAFRAPPIGTLDDFASADDLGNSLEVMWHGSFHNGISSAIDADDNYCQDAGPVASSPRDSMFWRSHKALDDVHSNWQQLQPSDIMIVLDRSGSMTGASSSGSPISKMDAAKSAAEMFTELVENGQGHNVGLVSFSSTATSPPDLALTPANTALAPVQAALAGVDAGGATAIGDGLLEAHNHLTTEGTNERQALLLLTDGKENRPPCLDGTGDGCDGAGADIATGAFGQTQICAVGFGDASTSLDEIVLRDLAELQGGIFIAGAGELQLKKFFLDCFSDIFDEFLAVDPIDILPAGKAESDPVTISSALDTKITFVLAWEQGKPQLELKITTPSGAVLDQNDPSIERSAGSSWLFVRVPLPYRGDAIGQWKAQAVRVDPPGRDQSFFVAGMVAGAGQLSPTNLRFNHYTGQPLWPVVRITAPYRPLDEFDKVEAIVTITRPLVGTGNLLSKVGLGDGTTIKGDAVDPRAARLLQLAKRSQGDLVPTVIERFPLYDDGTHGDRFANNHYWSTQLPSLGKIEGMYRYNFKFIISEGGQTFTREANHSIYVAVNIDPKATKTNIRNIGTRATKFGEGRTGTIITFVPQDSLGNLLGPGRIGSFELSTRGDVRIEGAIKDDGRGSYQATVSWSKKVKEPALALTQNGQPRLIVDLAGGAVITDLEPREHLLLHFTGANTTRDPEPPNTNVQRHVKTTSLAPGDIVDVSIRPSGFDSHYFGLKEDIGELEYTGSYSAAFNPVGTTFLTEQPNRPFTYKVRIPESAKAGEKFIIRGEYWNNPDAMGGFKSLIRRKTGETVLVVIGKETPAVTPPVTEEAPTVEEVTPAIAPTVEEVTPAIAPTVPLTDIVQEQVRGLCGGSPSGSVSGGQIGLLMLPLALGLTGAWRRGKHRKNSLGKPNSEE